MRSPVATAIAISFGLLVLIGYFIPADSANLQFILTIRSILIGWAVILAAVAALVGVFNMLFVNMKRMVAKRNPDRYGFVLVLAFLVTFVAGLWLGPGNSDYQKAVLAVQIPVEGALMGLVAITLTVAGLRLAQRRKTLMAGVFAVSAVVFLLLASGLLGMLSDFPVIGFIQRLPIAGGRGILLGIALGSLTAGLRVLLAADRPYTG